jgi:hypothetical protein
MGHTIGIDSLLRKKYKCYGFDDELVDMIGDIEIGADVMIWGKSGHGKTTFAGHLTKRFASYGKVYYNSVEQGDSSSFQNMARHVGLGVLPANTYVVGHKDSYEEMVEKLKKNRSRFCVIDSSYQMKLTYEQFRELKRLYPRKSFIIITYADASGKNPKRTIDEDIRYLIDIKVTVYQGIAYIDSRYGGAPSWSIPGVCEKFSKAMKTKKAQEQGNTEAPKQGTLNM